MGTLHDTACRMAYQKTELGGRARHDACGGGQNIGRCGYSTVGSVSFVDLRRPCSASSSRRQASRAPSRPHHRGVCCVLPRYFPRSKRNPPLSPDTGRGWLARPASLRRRPSRRSAALRTLLATVATTLLGSSAACEGRRRVTSRPNAPAASRTAAWRRPSRSGRSHSHVSDAACVVACASGCGRSSSGATRCIG